jgi:small-conductance mechanosensitive channel
MELIASYLPSLLLSFGLGAALYGLHWFLIVRQRDRGSERLFPRQLLMLGLSLLSIVSVILVLPIPEHSRNRLIGLIGLLVSGMIAFSSANILANLMGGMLLRIAKPFRIGDFIRVGEHFGRVTERGLF